MYLPIIINTPIVQLAECPFCAQFKAHSENNYTIQNENHKKTGCYKIVSETGNIISVGKFENKIDIDKVIKAQNKLSEVTHTPRYLHIKYDESNYQKT